MGQAGEYTVKVWTVEPSLTSVLNQAPGLRRAQEVKMSMQVVNRQNPPGSAMALVGTMLLLAPAPRAP
jgi:hypothetical protein